MPRIRTPRKKAIRRNAVTQVVQRHRPSSTTLDGGIGYIYAIQDPSLVLLLRPGSVSQRPTSPSRRSQSVPPDQTARSVPARRAGGMINPTTDAISEFNLPAASTAEWITAGPDGNLWFTDEYGRIGTINLTTDAITEYRFSCSIGPAGITTGLDGNLWFTETDTVAPTGVGDYWTVGVATLATSELVVTQQPPASVAAGRPFGLTEPWGGEN